MNTRPVVLAASIAALLAAAPPSAKAAAYTWNADLPAATWGSAANWNPNSAFPNAAGDVANLTNNISQINAITLDAAITVGILNLGDADGSNPFSISDGVGGSLIFDNLGSAAQINQGVNSLGDTIDATMVSTAGALNVANDAAFGVLTLSGTLNMGANSVTFGGSGTTSLLGALTGTAVLVKNGPGRLTLGGANTATFFGGVTINGGVVSINNAGNLGDVSGALALNGGTLETTGTTTTDRAVTLGIAAGSGFDVLAGTSFTINGLVSGAGAFTKSGAGVLALTNAGNTFGGVGVTIAINGGAVSVAADSALGNVNNAIALDGGALQASGTFTLAATRSVTLAGASGGIDVTTGNVLTVNHAITGSGSFAKSGAGTLEFGAVQNYLGDTNVLGGTLALTASNVLPNTGLLLGGGTLDLGANNETVSTVTMSGGGISGTGTLTAAAFDVQAGVASASLAGGQLIKTGGGTAALTGLNTFTGTVQIQGGVLSVNGDAALGNAANSIVLDGGALSASASFTPARTITLNPTFGNGLGADAGQTLTVGDNLIGTGGFTKIGAGTVELAGTAASTFSDLGVNLGVLLLNKPAGVDAIPNVPVTITSSAAGPAIIRLAANEQINNSAPLSWNINGGQSGTLDLNGFVETVGDLNISTTSTGTNPGGTNGVRTGAGGTLILSGNLTFNHNRNAGGNTGRELLITGTGTYGAAAAGDGTLDLGGVNRTITVTTNHTQANRIATIETTVINGGIVKEGNGWLSLNAVNSFAGGVVINDGRLRFALTSALNGFTGGITANTGGTLWLFAIGANSTDFNNAYGPSSNTITLDGGTILGAYSSAADRTMTDHPIIIGSNGGTIDITATSYTNFVESGQHQLRLTTTAGSTFTGTAGLTKNGGGRLTLNSVSPAFSGPWVVNSGTLEASGIGRLGDGSATNTLTMNGGNTALGIGVHPQNVTLNGGAISSITNLTVGTTTLAGAVDVTADSHFFLNDFYQDLGVAKTIAVAGVLSGTAALNVEVNRAGTDVNSGTLILQNAGNTYNGILRVGKNLRLQSNPSGGVGSTLGTAEIVLAGAHLQLRDNGAGSNGTLAYGNNVTLAVPTGLLNNGDLAGTHTINVARSSGTNTGNIFRLGTLTFGAGVTTLDVTGANGYAVEFLGDTLLSGATTFNTTTADLRLTGGITGGTDLIKNGAANLFIGNPTGATYTGSTTINGGGIVFATAAAVGGSGTTVTVGVGATAAAGFAIDQAFVNRIGNSSAGVIAAAANSANNISLAGFTLARFGAVGTASYTGALTPAVAGTYRLGGGGGTLIFPTTNYFTGAVNLDLGTNGTTPGVVALPAANDFTGSITLTGGQLLRPQTNASLGNAANVVTGDGGGIQFASGAPFDIFAVRPVTFGTGGFILDTNGNDFTPGAGITGNAGAGSFTKAGAGVLTFNAINTYTGATNVNGGVIAFANPNVIAVSSGLGANGGTFRYTGTTASTLGKTIAVGTTPGALTIDVANASADFTADQVISGGPAAGNIGLLKTGPGTLTLTNTGNTFTGNIRVEGGTFAYAGQAGAAASVLGAAGAKSITVDNGATLRATSASNLTSVTSIIVGPGGAIFDTPVTAGVNLQLDDVGQFSGTGNLTKTGAGTLQLGGVTGMNFSGYTGQIFVNAGTLLAANADGTTNRFVLGADTVATTIAGGATVDVRGLSTEPFNLLAGSSLLNAGGVAGIVNGTLTPTGNFTIGGAGTLTINSNIGTGFNVTKTGAGTTTLTAANTNSGATRITNGILALGGPNGALPGTTGVTLDSVSGATLQLNNEAAVDVFTSNNGDRLPNATPIAQNVNSTIWLRGVNSTTPGEASSETIGPVTLTNAQGTLRADSASPANTTTTLTVGSLARVGATVTLLQHSSAGTLGVGDRIFLASGAPTPTNGMVSPRFLNNTDQAFVTYGGNGFATAAFTSTDLNTATATSIVDQGATAVALGGNRSAYAVKLGTGAVTGNVLTIGSGGLILSGAATHTAGFTFHNGTQAIEGIVFSPAGINSVHTGQIVASALTKVGGGELNLNPSASAVTAGGLNNAQINVLGGTLRIGSNTVTNNNAVLPSSVKVFSAAGSTTIFQVNSTISSLTGNGTVQVGTDVSGATALTLTVNNNVNEVFSGLLQSDDADQNDISFAKGGAGSFTLNGTVQIGRTIQTNFGELILTNTAAPNASTGTDGTGGRQRVVALQGGTFTLDNSTVNNNNRLRLNSGSTGSYIQISGGTFNFIGNNAVTTDETVGVTTAATTAPDFGAGASTFALTAGTGQAAIFTTALPFTRAAGSSALIRGTNLGGTRGAANTTTFAYGSAPALVGPGALNTPTVGVLRGIIADSIIGGVDTYGLATYDAGTNPAFDADDIGVRRLNLSELATSIVSGDTTPNNVRLTSAIAGIDAATTINSLHLAGGADIAGSGTLTISAGTVLAANNGGAGSNTISLAGLAFGANEGVFYTASDLTVASLVTGTAGLTKGGAGVLTLGNAANSFSGGQGVTVNGGLLRVAADTALGAAANTVRLNNGGGLQASASFSSARAVALGNAGGRIDVANLADTLTLTGIVSGNLGAVNATTGIAATTGTLAQTTTVLTKTGAGRLALTGLNTYTGRTSIEGGTLAINADTALGNAAGGVAISNDAILQATGAITTSRAFVLGAGGGGQIDTNGNAVTLGAASTVTGTELTKLGAGTLTLAGTQTYATLTTEAGTATLDTPLGTGTSTVNAIGGTTNFNVGQTLAALNIGNGATVVLAQDLSPAPGFAGGEGASLGVVEEFLAAGASGGFDGAASVAAVPEPGAIALLASGALGLLGRRRSAGRRA